MRNQQQPATTWTLRGFPVELRAAVESLKWQKRLKNNDASVTNADVVADAVRYYLEHCGHGSDSVPTAQTQGNPGR